MIDNRKLRNIKIFCDFDGTITSKDLGDEIFKIFGEFEPFHTQLINNEINIIEYWNCIVPTLKNTQESEIEELALNSDIDAYFLKFLEMCKSNHYKLTIVSDGFSSYINPILKPYNSYNFKVFTNRINFNDIPKPEFYGESESCECLCASCKRNVVLNNTSDDDLIVFIGDGYSDFCAAEHSDIIFAKKNLAKYCSGKRIPFYNFSTFFDILKIFDNYHNGKIKFRNRRQAELKRKSAFEVE
jgi:2,3-diketo-5-methylthio-1-phosphopentane phosphatase